MAVNFVGLFFSIQASIDLHLGRLPARGPFHLGRWSWPINLASSLVRESSGSTQQKGFADGVSQRLQFTVFICVLFILPTATPVTQLNMNYAIVAIGGVVLIVGLVWTFWGRHRFSGPVQTLGVDEFKDDSKDE